MTRREASTHFKKNPKLPIIDMIALKPFEQLIEDGDIFGIPEACKRSGYTPQHLRRLCHGKKIDCLLRGEQFFFNHAALAGLFEYRKANA